MSVDPFSIPNSVPPITDLDAGIFYSETTSVVPVRVLGSALDSPYVIGATVFDHDDGVLRGYLFDHDEDAWAVVLERAVEYPGLVTAHQNTSWDVIPGPEDDFAHGLNVYGSDIETARDVEDAVFKALSEVYVDGFVPPFGTNHKDPEPAGETADPSECEHLQQAVELNIGNADVPIVMCQLCREFHGIQYGDDWIPRDAMYDADWFMQDLPTDRTTITNLDDNTYVLHVAPAPDSYDGLDALSRVDMSGVLLTRNTSLGTENQIGMFTPDAHGLHILIRDDEAVGVLLDTEGGHDPQILVLGVRAEFRGDGNATTLAETWIDHAGVESRYELFDPNDAGLAVFDRLGHYNDTPSESREPVDAVVTIELQRMDLSLDDFQTVPGL